MNLAIDVGNTRTKVAVYENDIISNIDVFDQSDFKENFLKILSKSSKKPKAILSSVKNLSVDDIKWLSENTTLTQITPSTNLPFTNKYSTPETLGIDRRVLAAGSVLKFPNTNRLIIDAGTCITYDFITMKNEYLGGAISPGINLKYKSLNDYTDKLPLLTISNFESLIGDSTNNSIHSGIINATTFEIDGFINRYLNEYQNLTIILTGGDAVFLAKRLKNTIFANSNFLLESLISIQQYIIDYDK